MSVRHPATAYDYVIVGGGTAGCVLANRLSADARNRVLMLEAGPEDRSPWIHLPIGYGKTMFHPVYNWGFYTDPDPGMDGRRIYWPRGRCLGGSSSINGLIYVRGQREDYDAWAAAGNRGWGWNDVLPYFVRSESNSRGASEAHGADGPLACSDIGARHELIEAIIAGAESLGVPRTDDFNAGDSRRRRATTSCSRATACAAARRLATCEPVRGRSNLTCRPSAQRRASSSRSGARQASSTSATARRCSAAARARGHPRGRCIAKSRSCCSSPASVPGALLQQLRHSRGLRPARRRREPAGPPAAAPAVSLHEADHDQRRPQFVVALGADRHRSGCLRRSGPLAVGINQGGLFTRVLPESTTPDIQFHFATLSADLAGAKPHPFPGFTFSVCQLRPTSRGHVRIASPDPLAAPSMQPYYLSTALDRRCARCRRSFCPRARRDAPPWRLMSPRKCARGRARRATTSCSRSAARTARRSSIRREPAAMGRDAMARRRRPAARAWRGRAARRRLLDHADARVGQHQCAGGDDRREGERHDPRGPEPMKRRAYGDVRRGDAPFIGAPGDDVPANVCLRLARRRSERSRRASGMRGRAKRHARARTATRRPPGAA